MRKPKASILPKHDDPTGVDSIERAATKELKRRLLSIGKFYIEAIDRFMPREILVNSNRFGIAVSEKRYTFDLIPELIASVFEELGRKVDDVLLEGGDTNRFWFFENYVVKAYDKGIAQSFRNLSRVSDVYRAAYEKLGDRLNTLPYQRRVALIRGRSFEDMANLSLGARSTMRDILTDGLARGQNPLKIAKTLETGIKDLTRSRAERIARTEVTTALRRARWDEAEDASSELGIETKMLHYSALSPTTRRSHAERHGQLFTVEEVRDWYSQNANAINCKCSQTEVLVNDDGSPLLQGPVDRMTAVRKQWFAQRAKRNENGD